jgi:hypothetical protein
MTLFALPLDLVSYVADCLADFAARFAEAVLDVAGVALVESFILQRGVAARATDARLDLAGGLIDTSLNFISIA